jgi:hypothetical protein
MNTYMGIDQYGNTYHGLKHPRKDLCERLGYSSSSAYKMYRDYKGNGHAHVGYVIGDHWVEVFRVLPWKDNLS